MSNPRTLNGFAACTTGLTSRLRQFNLQFHYMLANPPFGVEWKPEKSFVDDEHKEQGFNGRFGAGLPRINDGSLSK